MEIAFVLGWWALPLTITTIGIAWAIPVRGRERCRGDRLLDGLDYVVGLSHRLMTAVTISLVAWLIWALLR